MKIPHHLYLARSGRWHFRKRVPTDLLEHVGRPYIKKSLGTSRLAVAQVRAIAVNAQCLSIFTALRAQHMSRKPRKPPSHDEGLDRFDYTIRLSEPEKMLIRAHRFLVGRGIIDDEGCELRGLGPKGRASGWAKITRE